MKKLNPKQTRFVEEYLIDFNATQAAIRAGYSEKTARAIGQENLTKPYIQAEIAKRTKVTSEKLQITQEQIIQELLEVMRIGKELETPQLSAVNKSIELIGKHIGMWRNDSVKDIVREFAKMLDMSDEELDEIIEDDNE